MKNTCEVCGVKLTEENRSKSYRNRCKSCVAKRTAEKRSDSRKQLPSKKTKAQIRTEQILRKKNNNNHF